jgi:hypothetical protein
MVLTPAEKQLATALGFDEGVCKLIKQECRGPLLRLPALADGSGPAPVGAVAVALERDQVMATISKLQPSLLPRGYGAFWSEMFDGSSRRVVVATLKCVDESEIIRLQQTNGRNYDVSTEDILQRLQSWRSQCDLQVVGAGVAWVAIQFATLPQSICAFAEEVYEFCPDTVEQGVSLQNEKDHPKKFEAARCLCPQLSDTMERKLKEKRARFHAMQVPPQIRAMIQSSGFTTPTEMGIRLLAYELNESKQLFLWWD